MAQKQQQQTLVLVKPNAVARGLCGALSKRFEEQNLRIIGMKMIRMYRPLAETFYAEHKARPFFLELIKFIGSGPVVALVLEGANAVEEVRRLMGATDPARAEAGTLRADFGESLTANAVHGSDSPEAAQREISLLFKPAELYPAASRS